MTVELAHRLDGPAGAPVVALGPSLGTTWEMWDALTAALTSSYRVLRYDTRGHGRSPVPMGPYTVADLAEDVVALADSLDIARLGFVGLSLGGATGQLLAAHHGDRVAAAVLCCSAPVMGEAATWTERAAGVRAEGMDWLAEPTRARWFTDDFRAEEPDEVERLIAMLTATDPEGYASCCDALATFDATTVLGGIDVPVRVVAGQHDAVATPEQCEQLAGAIPGADLVVLPGTSHIATVAGEPFHRAVIEHLERHL